MSINGVPGYRAAKICHVQADLVCPAGNRMDFKQRMGRKFLQNTVLTDCLSDLFETEQPPFSCELEGSRPIAASIRPVGVGGFPSTRAM